MHAFRHTIDDVDVDSEKQNLGQGFAAVPVTTGRTSYIYKTRTRWLEYIIFSLAVAALSWRFRKNLLNLMYIVLSLLAAAVWGGSESAAAPTAPPGFPSSGNGLWYKQPGKIWARDYLPIGNGYLAAMVPGGATQEILQLNIESLWSGGFFADPVSVICAMSAILILNLWS